MNIENFLKARDWKCGRIRWDNGIPSPVCELCGRSEGVHLTQLGLKCRYCRGADGRHFSTIRALGGIPTVNFKPVSQYLRD